MNPWSCTFFLILIVLWPTLLYSWGYIRRENFNYNLGRGIGMGYQVDPWQKHNKILSACLLTLPFGGLFYLIGWIWAGKKSLDLGKYTGEVDKKCAAVLPQKSRENALGWQKFVS